MMNNEKFISKIRTLMMGDGKGMLIRQGPMEEQVVVLGVRMMEEEEEVFRAAVNEAETFAGAWK